MKKPRLKPSKIYWRPVFNIQEDRYTISRDQNFQARTGLQKSDRPVYNKFPTFWLSRTGPPLSGGPVYALNFLNCFSSTGPQLSYGPVFIQSFPHCFESTGPPLLDGPVYALISTSLLFKDRSTKYGRPVYAYQNQIFWNLTSFTSPTPLQCSLTLLSLQCSSLRLYMELFQGKWDTFRFKIRCKWSCICGQFTEKIASCPFSYSLTHYAHFVRYRSVITSSGR